MKPKVLSIWLKIRFKIVYSNANLIYNKEIVYTMGEYIKLSPESEPTLELHSRAVPSAEAHHVATVLTQEEIREEGG